MLTAFITFGFTNLLHSQALEAIFLFSIYLNVFHVVLSLKFG